MAVPPVGSSRPAPVAPRAPKAPTAPPKGGAPTAPAPQTQARGKAAAPPPANTPTAPAPTGATATKAPPTTPTLSPLQKALASARATRERIGGEVAAGKFQRTGVANKPEGGEVPQRQGISLRRAEALVNRVSVAQLYRQSNSGGMLGSELGRGIDTAGNAAQQEIGQIVQRAQQSQRTQPPK